MKTVFHANIDGQEIVLGFGEAWGLIDPMATAARIAEPLAATDECRQMQALNAEINARRQQAAQAYGIAEQARKRGDAPTQTRQNAEYQAKCLEVAELEKLLPARIQAFEALRAKMILESAVYAHPPQGEDLIQDEQAAALAAKYAERGQAQQLLLDGSYVEDLRGREYWVGPPWKRLQVAALGERPSAEAIPQELLTDAQRAEIIAQQEAERLAAFTPEERAAEAERARAAALNQAGQMRSEFEIAGDAEALAKSQAWYQGQLAEISAKYEA